jgi:hypothetical protein
MKLITAGYYIGHDGPKITLILESPDAVNWIDEVLLRLGESGTPASLTTQQSVALKDMDDLVLVRVEDGNETGLRKQEDDVSVRFIWSMSRTGIDHVRWLLEPFFDGRPGHQYMADEPTDDAEVEFSFGEEHSYP